MPTYEYVCHSCGHRFEAFQQMTDALLNTCPKCGKEDVKRLIGSGMGVIYKGSGFYTTDYKNRTSDRTCCGRSRRCDNPPCSNED